MQNDKLVEALEPTQADRDAALRYYLYTRSLAASDYRAVRATEDFLSGSKDQTEMVQAFARHRIAALSSPSDDGAGVLPCDVRLPPATTIRAGCSFETLRSALATEGRPVHFNDAHPPADALREAREIVNMIALSEFPGKRHGERLENARKVIAALSEAPSAGEG